MFQRQHQQDLVFRCDIERTLTWSYESGLDSWHDFFDLRLILSPLSLLFLMWNVGLFSWPPASLKAGVNVGGLGKREKLRGERRRKRGQNLLE